VLVSRPLGLDAVAKAGAGLVVDSNRKAMIAAIAELASESTEQLERRGAAGKQLVTDRFSWSRLIEPFVNMYQRTAQ
jgi:glycosyltransferase involved in cell wall biosynthesis